MHSKKLFFNNNLVLTIYLFGYPFQGESILCTISTDGQVCFSFIMDCFKQQDINITKQFIEKIGIKALNYVFWSHPHKDHSIGLDELIELCDDETKIILPHSYENYKEDFIDSNPLMFYYIESKLKSRTNNPFFGNVQTRAFPSPICALKFSSLHNYDFSIKALSPDTSIPLKYNLEDTELQINDLSLALWITLGDLSIILAGDSTNRTFEIISRNLELLTNEGELIKTDYLKIPHHGSETGKKVLNLVDGDVNVSTLTVYHKLPKKDMVDYYLQNTNNLYCTSDVKSPKQFNDYGIVETIFDITNSYSVKNKTYGNAIEIVKENLPQIL